MIQIIEFVISKASTNRKHIALSIDLDYYKKGVNTNIRTAIALSRLILKMLINIVNGNVNIIAKMK